MREFQESPCKRQNFKQSHPYIWAAPAVSSEAYVITCSVIEFFFADDFRTLS